MGAGIGIYRTVAIDTSGTRLDLEIHASAPLDLQPRCNNYLAKRPGYTRFPREGGKTAPARPAIFYWFPPTVGNIAIVAREGTAKSCVCSPRW